MQSEGFIALNAGRLNSSTYEVATPQKHSESMRGITMFETKYYRDDKGVIKEEPKVWQVHTHQRIVCKNSFGLKKRKYNKS